MFLLDRFFDGTFFTYGIEVMSFADRDQEDRIDPMIYVFPRFWDNQKKNICTIQNFYFKGWQNVRSTNLEPPEILRNMTPYVSYRSILVRTNWSMNLEKIMNISVNEKIYIFIWFWLLFLGFFSSLVIVYRIVIVFSPYIRAFVLRLRYRSEISPNQSHTGENFKKENHDIANAMSSSRADSIL